MTHLQGIKKSKAAALAAIALTVGLVGCSSPAPEPAPAGDERATALSKLLPDDIREAGTLQIASSFTTPPLYSFEEDAITPTGIIVELTTEATERLGLTPNWRQLPFVGQIPGLRSGQIDVAASQYTANEEVLSGANIIGMIGHSLALLTVAGVEFGSEAELCGKNVALTRGAADSVDVGESLQRLCADQGLPEVNLVSLDASEARLALRSGRADGYVLSSASSTYASTTEPNEYGVSLAAQWKSQVAGILVSKENKQLAEALAAAFAEMLEDGTYQTIADKWELKTAMIDGVELNGKPFQGIA